MVNRVLENGFEESGGAGPVRRARVVDSSRSGRRAKALIALLTALFVIPLGLLAVAAPANATTDDFVFWSDSAKQSIGQAKIDGKDPNKSFITGLKMPRGVAVAGEYLYWADASGNSIGRSKVDGTELNETFIPNAGNPYGIAVTSDHIYWTTPEDTIARANIDGSAVKLDFITGLENSLWIAATSDHLYWSSYDDNRIGRANPDGSAADYDFITDVDRPMGIAVTGDSLYWTSGGGKIGRANIDGSGVKQDLISGLNAPGGIAATSEYLYWADFGVPAVSRAKVDGSGLEKTFITGATFPLGVAVTPVKSSGGGEAATAVDGCVTAGGKKAIARTGTKRLMKPVCVANSGARIGVKVSAKPRKSAGNFKLVCVTGKGKVSKTRATGDAGTRYCKKGALNIRTFGVPLKLRVTWHAPAAGDFAAYHKVKTYKN